MGGPGTGVANAVTPADSQNQKSICDRKVIAFSLLALMPLLATGVSKSVFTSFRMKRTLGSTIHLNASLRC